MKYSAFLGYALLLAITTAACDAQSPTSSAQLSSADKNLPIISLFLEKDESANICWLKYARVVGQCASPQAIASSENGALALARTLTSGQVSPQREIRQVFTMSPPRGTVTFDLVAQATAGGRAQGNTMPTRELDQYLYGISWNQQLEDGAIIPHKLYAGFLFPSSQPEGSLLYIIRAKKVATEKCTATRVNIPLSNIDASEYRASFYELLISANGYESYMRDQNPDPFCPRLANTNLNASGNCVTIKEEGAVGAPPHD